MNCTCSTRQVNLILTHWGCASPYGAEVPGQPSLAPTSGDARSQSVSGERHHMATKTLELHTATYPQISHMPIGWHRSNRYSFCFIIQSKLSLHRLSVETGNTDLTWPGQSCIHKPRYIGVWILSETMGFLLSKCYFLLQKIKMYVLRCISIGFKQKYGHKTSRSAGMNLRRNSGFTAN